MLHFRRISRRMRRSMGLVSQDFGTWETRIKCKFLAMYTGSDTYLNEDFRYLYGFKDKHIRNSLRYCRRSLLLSPNHRGIKFYKEGARIRSKPAWCMPLIAFKHDQISVKSCPRRMNIARPSRIWPSSMTILPSSTTSSTGVSISLFPMSMGSRRYISPI